LAPITRVSEGLHAALLLARGRPDGLQVLAARDEPTTTTAVRSFWAVALCLPAFVCLQLIDLAQDPHASAGAAHGMALRLIGYVIGWAGFAVLSHSIARAMGRSEAWPRFIAAYNWCNVVQYLLLVTAALPPLLHLPDIIGETAFVVAAGWAIWLEWYVGRLALEISGLQATALVLLDLALAFGIDAVINALTLGAV